MACSCGGARSRENSHRTTALAQPVDVDVDAFHQDRHGRYRTWRAVGRSKDRAASGKDPARRDGAHRAPSMIAASVMAPQSSGEVAGTHPPRSRAAASRRVCGCHPCRARAPGALWPYGCGRRPSQRVRNQAAGRRCHPLPAAAMPAAEGPGRAPPPQGESPGDPPVPPQAPRPWRSPRPVPPWYGRWGTRERRARRAVRSSSDDRARW